MKSKLPSIETFIKERNEALFSFDEKKIRAYCKKYDVPMPENPIAFWAAICKAICNIKNAPHEIRRKASEWLKENNFREDVW